MLRALLYLFSILSLVCAGLLLTLCANQWLVYAHNETQDGSPTIVEIFQSSGNIPNESVFYALDFKQGQQIELKSGIPLIRSIEYLHNYNGIPIEGDILSVSVAGDKIVKIRACWHEIISEHIDKRKKVVGLEDSLGKATEKLAQKFNKKENLRFKLKIAQLCYYGFNDAGKKEKLFVPAWHFIIEKDGETYHQFINAHSNQPINYEEDIKNAQRKQ